MNHTLLLLGAGLMAGAMNALAGGGSFVSLAALVAAGVPPVSANASSSVALYPGGAASTWVYRDRLSDVCGVPLKPALFTTLAGGFIGALLLLLTPGAVFDHVLPWLLLVSTTMLIFGPKLGPALHGRVHVGTGPVLAIQFVLGIYGGYFGGAVGLMMLAAWSLLDTADVKALQAPRTLMTTAANTVAILCFIVAGAVWWPQTLLVCAGAAVGGYGGAHLGRVLPERFVRAWTITIALVMTVIFFRRAYL